MNRKQIVILGIVVALALVLTFALVLLPKQSESDDPIKVPPVEGGSQTVQKETESTISAGTESAMPVDSDTDTTGPDETEAKTAEPDQSSPPAIPAVPPKTSSAETEFQGVTFPYAIPDTPLVIETIKSYDGIYLEDGSDIEISGVSAIILRNAGNECVEYVKIQMAGSKTNLSFVASGLEPGASVAVMEAEKAPAVSQDYDQITAEIAFAAEFERSEEILQVQDTEDGQLEVTNKSNKDIPCVRVFYKFYMEDKQVYVGGITYTTKITNLKAGDSVNVSPSNYSVGSSKVIMVKTYDTDME